MTLASALFGGSSGADYVSGNLYPAIAGNIGTTASVPNKDIIVPFFVRKTVTIDKVAWYRDNTTAANVYVGIYSVAGALLTDCAIDTDTVAGWHLVDTTNITLLPSRIYYLCWNASVDVAGTVAVITAATENVGAVLRNLDFGYAVGLGAAPATGGGTSYSKARTNAALLSSFVLTGWALESPTTPLGFVPA